MKVMRVFSRVSCDTGWVKCDSSSWRLCWNNDYLCSQDVRQYRWFYDPVVKEALLHVPYNNFFDFIDLAASAGVLPALQYNLICFLFLYWPIDLDGTRITEWMLWGADSSHGSLLAQAMELCVLGSMAGANGLWFRRSAGRRSTKGSWLRRIYQYSFISSRASSSDKERLFLIRSSVFSKLQPRSLQLLMRAWITWFRPSIRPELRPSISPVLCPSVIPLV